MSEDKNKQDKLAYLVDELGRIDDKYIQECLDTEEAVPKRSVFSRALLLAAVISVVAVLALSAVMGSLIRGGMNKEESADADMTTSRLNENYSPPGDSDEGDKEEPSDPDRHPEPEDSGNDGDGGYESLTLQELLYDLSRFGQTDITSEPLSLLDNGGMYIIWSCGDGDYYFLEIEEEITVQNITSLLEKDSEQAVPADDMDCCVWITLSDSRVYSPYLTERQVDISSGTLEMYTAQTAIDEELELILIEAIYNALQ